MGGVLVAASYITPRTMTKVQLQYELGGLLDEEMLSRIAGAHSIYGIHRLFVSPDQRQMTVEYDASRLSISQVDNALRGAGIQAKRAQ
jgi:hypothetical protein